MVKIDGDVVTMSKAEYDDFYDDYLFLNCLRNAGVDNWCGYDYAQEEYQASQEDE